MKNNFELRRLSVAILQKMTHTEVNGFFKRALTKIGLYGIEDPHVIMLVENASKHLEVQEELSKTPMAHEATPEIQSKFDECRDNLTRVKETIMTLRRVRNAEEKEMYKVLNFWIRTARRNMTSYARMDQAEAVRALKAGVEANPMILNYLETLNIDKSFEQAVQLDDEMIKLSNERSQDRGYYKDVRLDNRETAVFNLQLLFNTFVAMANVENSDQEMYQDLCRTLDTMLIETHAVWKSRITRLANGEDISDEEDMGFDNSDPVDPNPDDSSDGDDE